MDQGDVVEERDLREVAAPVDKDEDSMDIAGAVTLPVAVCGSLADSALLVVLFALS